MDETLKRFKNELDYLIKQQTNPFSVAFFMQNYGKEHFTDEDAIETRGYFKGLKVAMECLEKHIAIAEETEEYEEGEVYDD